MSEKAILQRNLVQFLVKDVFNTITEDDILRIERTETPLQKDKWFYKGQQLPPANVELLQTQAQSLKESELWKLLKHELLWHAQEKGLYKSQTPEDQIASKLLIYFTDIIDSKLNSMSDR